MSTRGGLRITVLLIAAVMAAAMLSACAGERFLSAEQDAEMRANCENGGCTCIPARQWDQIEQLLRRLGVLRDS